MRSTANSTSPCWPAGRSVPVVARSRFRQVRQRAQCQPDAGVPPPRGRHPPPLGGARACTGTAAETVPRSKCNSAAADSNVKGVFPSIAGQSAPCLSEQLRDFSSKARASDLMSRIASALSPDEIAAVAAYYASIQSPIPPVTTATPELVKKGREIAETGNTAKGLP